MIPSFHGEMSHTGVQKHKISLSNIITNKRMHFEASPRHLFNCSNYKSINEMVKCEGDGWGFIWKYCTNVHLKTMRNLLKQPHTKKIITLVHILILNEPTQKLMIMMILLSANYHSWLQQVQIILCWIMGLALVP